MAELHNTENEKVRQLTMDNARLSERLQILDAELCAERERTQQLTVATLHPLHLSPLVTPTRIGIRKVSGLSFGICWYLFPVPRTTGSA